ncbi:hypothetical protein STAS_01032 [Striga asiatica]|uniref:Uncharacterized protein n=1 Tax=Striga asiatica TaxID=4170 RepID=A0A5A7NY46_STRAF|nr:hypothetical protein STAS_01032 [Striga asiatica]
MGLAKSRFSRHTGGRRWLGVLANLYFLESSFRLTSLLLCQLAADHRDLKFGVWRSIALDSTSPSPALFSCCHRLSRVRPDIHRPRQPAPLADPYPLSTALDVVTLPSFTTLLHQPPNHPETGLVDEQNAGGCMPLHLENDRGHTRGIKELKRKTHV